MERHFFDPEDLYLCKNVARVFGTLSVLSHSPKVRKSGVPGFPKKEKQLAKKLKREMSNYEELNRIYGEAETEFIYDSFSLPHSALQQGQSETAIRLSVRLPRRAKPKCLCYQF